MAFNNPAWLWGLAGLVIPIAIHLLSRKEGQVIKIGSLRFLNETATQQFKSIKLNEIILLIIRACIVVVLVLFLCELMMSQNSSKENWVLIDPQIKQTEIIDELLDSLKQDNQKVKFLQTGFPDYDNSHFDNALIDYWNVVEKLKHQNFHEAIIISNSKASGFFGDRISKPENIKWISVPDDEIIKPVYANRVSRDSIHIAEIRSNECTAKFSSKTIFWPNSKSYYKTGQDSILIDTTRINILIHHDETFKHDASIIQKALELIQHQTRFEGRIDNDANVDYKKYNWLIWLSESPIQKTFKGNLISFRERDSQNLIEKVTINEWCCTHKINSNLAMNEHLTLELAKILLDRNEDQLIMSDQRVMPENMMWSTETNATVAREESRKSASNYLFMALVGLIVLERIISYTRKS